MMDLRFQISSSEQWAELFEGPLELAASQGNRDRAQKLVEAGAKIGEALHEAVLGGHGEVVDNGASINAKQTKEVSTLPS